MVLQHVHIDGIKTSHKNVLYQHNKTIRKPNYTDGAVANELEVTSNLWWYHQLDVIYLLFTVSEDIEIENKLETLHHWSTI